MDDISAVILSIALFACIVWLTYYFFLRKREEDPRQNPFIRNEANVVWNILKETEPTITYDEAFDKYMEDRRSNRFLVYTFRKYYDEIDKRKNNIKPFIPDLHELQIKKKQ
jgi:hypothetical protein